ncbi:type II toxin-antitoxin system PemK/MazF family toxin [Candidatus Babeliales bacterium]|nr:type II toxin-antitoxin system PemK/MazF family toxin [Candidatus Babeliales bacterium]MCF7899321.1 type II toxin-antitoxin system PemK/MazF family toxin [Candidatus Babeliales bacterium]
MKNVSNTYKIFDIVVVSFPFLEIAISKNRPAIVISGQDFNRRTNHTALAMITSSLHLQWPCDTIIKDLNLAGLLKSSIVRFKIFTLDNSFIKQKIGELSLNDQEQFKKNFNLTFDLK